MCICVFFLFDDVCNSITVPSPDEFPSVLTSLKALSSARQQAESLKSQLSEIEHTVSTAQMNADKASHDLTSQSATWEQERQELTEKMSQSDKEQTMLQEQVIKVSANYARFARSNQSRRLRL